MKSFSIILILLGLSVLTYGQNKKQQIKKDTTTNWEVGLDLLWLIDKNQVPSSSLFARYHFLAKNQNKMAWRIRLGVDNHFYDSAQISTPYDKKHIIAPYLRTGIEWQKDINDKVSYFYGVDVSTFYYHEKSKNIIYFSVGPRLYQATDITWQWGIIPLIGIKYKPAKWISVSVESSLNFTYRVRREKDKVTEVNYPNDSGARGEVNINEFKTTFLPITVINLSFYLSNSSSK